MSEPTYTPPDAFGLLRSYSRHRDFVRLALTRIVHALELRAIELRWARHDQALAG